MAGLMGSNVNLSIFLADPAKFAVDKLREHAFVPELDADVVRFGWVGLGDMLDYTAFELATPLGGFAAFSFRYDARKPSAAVLKLKLAEAIVAEEAKKGGHLSKARKKELREEITAALTKKADFVPTLTDCLWDLEHGVLFLASSSIKVLENICEFMQTTFDVTPERLTPKTDMAQVLMQIHQSTDLHVAGYAVNSMGSASLVTNEQAEAKSQVTVQNDVNAVAAALQEGLVPNKLHLQAILDEDTDVQLDFVLGTDLSVSKLKLPKPEKDASQDAVLLVNADLCAKVAAFVQALSQGLA
ncbi:MAG: recombination-associated protein RdgC [Desulfovibrionaceae bacterium]|nr:recombination-associated protein RdgC [Desulfovibrionaceae bacterium]